MPHLEEYLSALVTRGGSDLHLSPGAPVKMRLHGDLVDLAPEPLAADDSRRMVYSVLNNDQIATFERDWELDLSFGVEGIGRFRANVFLQKGSLPRSSASFPSKCPAWRAWACQCSCARACAPSHVGSC